MHVQSKGDISRNDPITDGIDIESGAKILCRAHFDLIECLDDYSEFYQEY